MNAEPRRDQLVLREQGGHHVGRGDAEREADDDADQRHDQDLRQIDPENQPRRRPQAFQRRDRRRLSAEIGAHGVADADTADQQRG